MQLRAIVLASGLVAGLAACGGGSSEPEVPKIADLPPVAISPANLTAAKGAAAALVAAPAVTLPALTSKEGVALPAGTTLKFDALPTGASASALSGFTLTNGGSSAKGVLTAGSCIFTVTTAGAGFVAGTVLTFEPCSIDFNTAGVPANGTSTNVAVTIGFGGASVSVPNIPIVVNVVNGVAQIVSPGGGVIGTGTVTTGTGG